MLTPTLSPADRARLVARIAHERYLAHVRHATDCVCAVGDLCQTGQRLDSEAGAAYRQAELAEDRERRVR
jgi:hypothetical protein